MGETGGWVSNEVIALKIDTLTTEVQLLRQELVRRDVYNAERAADHLRISALETQLTQGAGSKRQVMFALIAAGLSLAVSVALRFIG